jgi:hypothetical protein
MAAWTRRKILPGHDGGGHVAGEPSAQLVVSERARGRGKPGRPHGGTVRVACDQVGESALDEQPGRSFDRARRAAVERGCGYLDEPSDLNEPLEPPGLCTDFCVPLRVCHHCAKPRCLHSEHGVLEREWPAGIGELEQDVLAPTKAVAPQLCSVDSVDAVETDLAARQHRQRHPRFAQLRA